MSERLFDLPPRRGITWNNRGNAARYVGLTEADVRRTPRDLFNLLSEEFGPFDIDVAALPDNALCPRYFTPDDNGLAQVWAPHRCWMNPPYSSIRPWVKKAYEESRRGTLVVGLLPARTDMDWFHVYVLPYAEIRFIRGRLPFGGMRGKAPFASMVAVWESTNPSVAVDPPRTSSPG